MDWPSLLVGALVGGVVGLVLQNILFPRVEQRVRTNRQQAAIRRSAKSWSRFEELYRRLVLVQAGWDSDGCFVEGTVVFRLADRFELGATPQEIRDQHAAEWLANRYTDGEQVGIKMLSVHRVSDVPSVELEGRAHRIVLTMHQYRYFDFLATHMTRLNGSDSEKAVLDAIAADANRERPVNGFPTPCSVGLSLILEDGRRLLLPRRSNDAGVGDWEGGKIFNAAGENATLRDFVAAHRSAGESTPEVVARRALHEEVGLSDIDIKSGRLRLHSFAWAPDLLDFKFFGLFETSLTEPEIRERWRHAPDRAESLHADTVQVGSRAECIELLVRMRENASDWSPEAVFCTVRSLIVLRRITTDDVLNVAASP